MTRPLTDEEKAGRYGPRNVPLLDEPDQREFLRLTQLGFGRGAALRMLGKSEHSLTETRKHVHEFNAEVWEALKARRTDLVTRSMIALARGRVTATTEIYAPILDEKGEPKFDAQGQACVRLVKRVVRKPGPSLEAQKTYLAAHDEAFKPEVEQAAPGACGIGSLPSREELLAHLSRRAKELTDNKPPTV